MWGKVSLVVAALGFSVGVSAIAAPVSYTLDPTHTQVVFSVERFGISRVVGFFGGITGEVVLDDAQPEKSSVHATIPIASLNTGNAERDGFLRGKFWLKGETFPNMEFRSTSVRLTDQQRAEISGVLSLAGVTAPVKFQVSLNKRGQDMFTKQPSAGFSGLGTLRRSTFGVRTAPPIGDEVRFSIEALGQVAGSSEPKPPAQP